MNMREKMADTTFEKLSRSDKVLYGTRKFLLCGFSKDAQPKFKAVLDMAGLSEVPPVWLHSDDAAAALNDLMKLDADHGIGRSSDLPRAIIVAGITENELQRLMTICRKTGMKSTLWASLTPTSENWQLNELLTELKQERKALSKWK